jgi:hypothetical protein
LATPGKQPLFEKSGAKTSSILKPGVLNASGPDSKKSFASFLQKRSPCLLS